MPLGFCSLDISDRSLVNGAGITVLLIMVTFDHTSGRRHPMKSWAAVGFSGLEPTPKTEQELHGVTWEHDGSLALLCLHAEQTAAVDGPDGHS